MTYIPLNGGIEEHVWGGIEKKSMDVTPDMTLTSFVNVSLRFSEMTAFAEECCPVSPIHCSSPWRPWEQQHRLHLISRDPSTTHVWENKNCLKLLCTDTHCIVATHKAHDGESERAGKIRSWTLSEEDEDSCSCELGGGDGRSRSPGANQCSFGRFLGKVRHGSSDVRLWFRGYCR